MRARRFGNGDRIRMKAPSVPTIVNGIGRK